MKFLSLKLYCHACALRGRVYTADALHTQRAFTQAVVDLRGYYLLTVKENQPTFYADLQTYFSDPEASMSKSRRSTGTKGELEVRQIRVTTMMNAYLACWPGLAQVAQLKRSVTTSRKEENFYPERLSLQCASNVGMIEEIND